MKKNGFSFIDEASGADALRGCGRNASPSSLGTILLALTVALTAMGCVQVPAHKQRLVSKPNMEFSDSLVFNYQNKLLPQIEPGSAFSGGAQSSGCTSCK